MLTESFIASTLISDKSTSKVIKDASISHYDFQPLQALKGNFKKSSTQKNCLAVSESQIFAAQADKSVVHVYSRDRGNQEVVVPFHDRIRSIALAADDDGGGVLALGTEGGGVIFWELCTGRQVSTPPSHLHPTTCLAVDPTSNFLLSGSPDSNIHVWSIPSVLAFSASYDNDLSGPHEPSLVRSLSNHRAAINAIVIGHSASKTNIAVSASEDSSCIVWDFIEGTLLHTFLMPSVPLCLAVDPGDRGFCAGYSDGSIHSVDFYADHSFTHAVHDAAQYSMPTQPPSSDRWSAPKGPPSPALTIQYSYDGTILLSGHENGIIQKWETANGQHGNQAIDLGAPVTNLKILAPTGFSVVKTPLLRTNYVTKPRYENLMNGATTSSTHQLSIPIDYTFTAQLLAPLQTSEPTTFDIALSSPVFSPSLISASLASFNPSTTTTTTTTKPNHLPSSTSAQTSSLDPSESSSSNPTTQITKLEAQNRLLYSQLETALQNQRVALKQVLKLERERYERTRLDKRKASRKRKRRVWRMGVEQRRREEVMGEMKDEDERRMEGVGDGDANAGASKSKSKSNGNGNGDEPQQKAKEKEREGGISETTSVSDSSEEQNEEISEQEEDNYNDLSATTDEFPN